MLNNGERFYPYFKVIYYIDIIYFNNIYGTLIIIFINENENFKNCIRTIYGKHIDSKEDVSSYKGGKSYHIMNVLVADTFNIKFTYILHG
jgi:hypothetical protein